MKISRLAVLALLGLTGLVNHANADIRAPFGPSAVGVSVTPTTMTASQCLRSDSTGSSLSAGPGCGGGADEMTVRAPATFVSSATVQGAFDAQGNVNLRNSFFLRSGQVNSSGIAFSINGASLTVRDVVNATMSLVGHDAPLGRLAENSEVVGSGNWAGIAISGFNSGNSGAIIDLQSSASDTKGAHSVVAAERQIGNIVFRASDGTNFEDAAYTLVQIDGTPGNNDMPGRYQIFTTPDGTNSSVRRVVWSQNGSMVQIASMTVQSDINATGELVQGRVLNCTLGLTSTSTGAITGCVSSDRSLKRDIRPLRAVDIDALRPVQYRWKDSGRGIGWKAGFVAQDLEKSYPEAVVSAGEGLKGVDPNAIVAALLQEVQALRKRVAALEKHE